MTRYFFINQIQKKDFCLCMMVFKYFLKIEVRLEDSLFLIEKAQEILLTMFMVIIHQVIIIIIGDIVIFMRSRLKEMKKLKINDYFYNNLIINIKIFISFFRLIIFFFFFYYEKNIFLIEICINTY